MDNQIKEELLKILNEINLLRNKCKKLNLLNTQEYIDFENKLNDLSVMDPNE